MTTFQPRLPSSQTITLPAIPELFDPSFLDKLLPPAGAGVSSRASERGNEPLRTSSLPEGADNRTLTTKDATAPKSTGSATLDAFNGLNARSRKSLRAIDATLNESWAADPQATLRIIWNMRSIHDGKGEKELFYRTFGWLYEHHPRTAITNLHMIVSPVCSVSKGELAPHGYWKDLLNLLGLATCGELLDFPFRSSNFLRTYTPKNQHGPAKYPPLSREEQSRKNRKQKNRHLHAQLITRLEEPKYRALYIAVARLFAERLRHDIRALDELQSVNPKSEREEYLAITRKISLAGKWAPTPGGCHDRVTNISTAICQLLFSPDENAGPSSIGPLPIKALHSIASDTENCAILRNYYHHWILKPLRQILACPEPLMSANKWNEIQYSRVPSICMARNKAHFVDHDPEGFHLFLADVRSRKQRISGATLMPHELIGEAILLQKAVAEAQQEEYPKVAEFKRAFAEEQLEVVDAQWRSLISRLRESGSFESALAICDLSDSMGSIHEYEKQNVKPIFPCVALSLAVASVAQPPFDAGIITFSQNPQFVHLEGLEEKQLTDLVNEVLKMESGGNTDLQAVFLNLLLPLAKEKNIAKEDMVKCIFVFSNMQFDHAAGMVTGPWWLNRTLESEKVDRWETSYDLIEKAFHEAGYDVPEIVFWNLAGDQTIRQTVEVEGDRKGVTMMSGFSGAMMNVFMGEESVEDDEKWMEVTSDGEVYEAEDSEDEDEDEMTPLKVMMKALYQKSYDGLVVVD